MNSVSPLRKVPSQPEVVAGQVYEDVSRDGEQKFWLVSKISSSGAESVLRLISLTDGNRYSDNGVFGNDREDFVRVTHPIVLTPGGLDA